MAIYYHHGWNMSTPCIDFFSTFSTLTPFVNTEHHRGVVVAPYGKRGRAGLKPPHRTTTQHHHFFRFANFHTSPHSASDNPVPLAVNHKCGALRGHKKRHNHEGAWCALLRTYSNTVNGRSIVTHLRLASHIRKYPYKCVFFDLINRGAVKGKMHVTRP